METVKLLATWTISLYGNGASLQHGQGWYHLPIKNLNQAGEEILCGFGYALVRRLFLQDEVSHHWSLMLLGKHGVVGFPSTYEWLSQIM